MIRTPEQFTVVGILVATFVLFARNKWRHDVVAVTMTDPRELEIPPVGLIELEDAETGEEILVDTGDEAGRQAYQRHNKTLREARDQMFRVTGIDTIHAHTDRPYIDPVIRFFKKRERMLR